MNLLAKRLLEARANKEVINYFIGLDRLELLTIGKVNRDGDKKEIINDVSIARMQEAVRFAGFDVAKEVLTIWS